MMTMMIWEFLRCRRRRFSSARGPRVDVGPGAVGLGGRRRQLGARRCQRGRVHLHVDGRETFSEDGVVRLEVNVKHRTARHKLRWQLHRNVNAVNTRCDRRMIAANTPVNK